MILSAIKNRLRAGLVNTPCKQIQPLNKIKTLNGPRVRRISSVGVSLLKGLWLPALSVSTGLTCNFVAVYWTSMQFILQVKLCIHDCRSTGCQSSIEWHIRWRRWRSRRCPPQRQYIWMTWSRQLFQFVLCGHPTSRCWSSQKRVGLFRSRLRTLGTHYHPTLAPAVLWTFSNDTSRPIFSDSLNLTPAAPLYLRTLWRYTYAVIIIINIIIIIIMHIRRI